MRYQQQGVLITGAAQGIGFATARLLAAEGATVAIVDLDGAKARKAAEAIAKAGHAACAFEADVTDPERVRAVVGEVHSRLSRIDVLVNNVGAYPHIPFEQVTPDQWRHVLDINLTSTYLVTQAVIPFMRARRYGRIVNTASGVVFNGIPNVSAYAASKAGIIGLSRVLASEFGPEGITTNVVSPGLVESEGVMDQIEGLFEAVIETQSVKRRGTPDDIAACIAYLASREAGFLNGQTINIDGGARFH